MRRAFGRLAVLSTLIAAAAVAIGGAPAGAVVNGPCSATGTIDTTVYKPGRVRRGEVVTVPKAATVRWEGSVVRPPAGRVGYEGDIELTVAGFDVTVDRWRGPRGKRAGEGERPYDVGALPGGVVYRLHGSHRYGRVACTGEVLVQLEGGKGAAVPIAYAGTAATFLLLVVSAARGRRILGAVAGLVLGGFVAVDLVLFARADLASRGLLVFPIAGLVLGATVAMTRRSRPTSPSA